MFWSRPRDRILLLMKLLLENWGKFLKEEISHYSMEIQIKAGPDTQLYGTIFNKIRAIEGITIIKTTSKMQKDDTGNKYVTMNIKFLANPGLPQSEFLHMFKRKINSLKDDQGDRIKSTRILKLPEIFK